MPEEEENDQTPPPVEESVEAPAVESKDTAENDDDNVKVTLVPVEVEEDATFGERMWEVLTTFAPLGFVAFGGPQVKYIQIILID